MSRIRTYLPWIWVGIVALLFMINAATLRFALASYLQADVAASTQLFASQVSARDLAWSVFAVLFLIRREAYLAAVLLLMRITIDAQDVASLLIGLAQGTQPPRLIGAAVFTLALIVLHALAAWGLFRRVAARQPPVA